MAEERGQEVLGGPQEEDKYSSVIRSVVGAAEVKHKAWSVRGGRIRIDKKHEASLTETVARSSCTAKPASVLGATDSGYLADDKFKGGPTSSAPPARNAWELKPVLKNPPAAANSSISSRPTSSGVKV
jgi:hypothetical protein